MARITTNLCVLHRQLGMVHNPNNWVNNWLWCINWSADGAKQ